MDLKQSLKQIEGIEEKEAFVLSLIETMLLEGKYKEVSAILVNLQNDWEELSTARFGKILTKIFERIDIDENNFEDAKYLLQSLIDNCGEKKLLKCDLECKMIHAYLMAGMYKECLDLIKKVVTLLKKFEDKINLIRIFLYESRVYYELRNTDLARSSLTAARAMAVSTVCPSALQAQIDLLNGMFLIDDACFDSAVGYLVESIEGFSIDKQFVDGGVAFRYLILCKILSNKFKEIPTILNAKYIKKLKEHEEDDFVLELLLKVKDIAKNRDVVAYQNLLNSNDKILKDDIFMYKHLSFYYNKLLEQNIMKIIEPYSHVKISFIADKLHFESSLVEDKLRMMILDRKIYGILDHKSGCLVVFDFEEDVESEFTKNIKILHKFMDKIK